MGNDDTKERLLARRAADGVAPNAGFENDDATFTLALIDALTAPGRDMDEVLRDVAEAMNGEST